MRRWLKVEVPRGMAYDGSQTSGVGVSVPAAGEFIQAKTSQAVYVLGHPIRTLMSAGNQFNLYDVREHLASTRSR